MMHLQDHGLIPVWGEIQLSDVRLEEVSVTKVTIVFLVLFHKLLHEIHSCHMMGLTNEVARVSSSGEERCVRSDILQKVVVILMFQKKQHSSNLPQSSYITCTCKHMHILIINKLTNPEIM